MTEKDFKTIYENLPFTTYAWAEDFIKALARRPKAIRLLLRFVFGKHAYREFVGMTDGFIMAEFYMNYELDEQEYHKEKIRNDFTEGMKFY